MRRTFRTALANMIALGAFSGAPFAHAQPRDITLPELLGGPDGDSIRGPDMMPVPRPTVPRVDEDGQPIAGKPARPPPTRAPATAPQIKPAAKPKPLAQSKPMTRAKSAAASKPAPVAKGRAVRPTVIASARAKAPPAAKPAPPLRAIQIGRTPQQSAPGRVPLPDDAASAPDLAALPEPQTEVAEVEVVPDVPAAPQDAPAQAMQASGQNQGFGPEFAEVEATIQRGARRGDFTRRQAASLYAELDDIAAMDDYFSRTGQGDRARVADRLADLRNYLARQTPY